MGFRGFFLGGGGFWGCFGTPWVSIGDRGDCQGLHMRALHRDRGSEMHGGILVKALVQLSIEEKGPTLCYAIVLPDRKPISRV